MARLGINTGTVANDGTGDSLRSAGIKINSNFSEIYSYLGAGSTDTLSAPVWNTTTSGISTLRNVGLGTTNPRFALEVGSVGASGTSLWVNGNARVTGILTVGSSSIILNGVNDSIRVGSGITIDGSSGSITLSSLIVAGTPITGSSVTSITAGSGISVNQSTGNVTISATNPSQWRTTTAGISTTSNVGIGTTNPQGTLQVGTAVTIYGTSGIVSATSFYGSGANLSGIVTSLVGYATEGYVNNAVVGFITSGALVGYATEGYVNNALVGYATEGYVNNAATQWVITTSGIHTLSSVGIGTTNPTGSLTVSGLTSTTNFYVTGFSTFSNKVSFASSISVGDSEQLKVYFDGNRSRIEDVGTGGLALIGDPSVTISDPTLTSFYATFNSGESVDLYYNGFKKFETTNSGVVISGIATATSFSGSAAGLTNIPAGQLTGALPAIDGSALIGVTASGVGIEVREDGTPIGTAGTINFDTNLTVTFASGTATVSGVSSVSFATTAYALAGSPDLNVGIVTATTFYGNGVNLSGVVTSLVGYATEGYVNNSVIGFTTSGDLVGFITSGALVGYATEGYVDNAATQWVTTSAGIHTLSSVGIGTTNPTSKLTVRDGDISVGVSTAHGVILTSPNGTQYRLIVADDGILSTSLVS